EAAALVYEDLRRGLIGFFTWRGAATPDECADATLDRLAVRLREGVEVGDVGRFVRGIARLVLLEHWRRPGGRAEPLPDSLPEAPAPAQDADEDALHACLDRCLGRLPAEGRALIIDYYSGQGGDRIASRKRIALRQGVSESALRNRAQRLRDRLERCIRECMAGNAGARST
ncbi:MAG TPA: hypothetical protein VFO85_18260, partial [Vicinamibacteria bacterium]|nr:hypothetical protein [Vicinamibacteria bacterium]